jgi:RNA polymerase sigma-70 factor (ECF subfamily)
MHSSDPSSAGAPRAFHTTRWSLVLAARAGGPALEELCRAYWWPLYAYARRAGAGAHEAEDVVQGFFTRLFERRDLGAIAPERGRFRAFLLAALKNHLANERDHARAEKRGGGRVRSASELGLDFSGADARLATEAGDASDPERAFEAAFARELLRAALSELEAEYRSSGRARVFETLKGELAGDDACPLAEQAERLGLTLGAAKVAAHRLRARFREKVRARIAATVAREEDIEDELAALLAALGNG